MEQKLEILNKTEIFLKNELEQYQNEYNALISSLAQLSDKLNKFQEKNNNYKKLNEKLLITKKNMLIINIICLLLFIIKLPIIIIIISSIFIIFNISVNLIKISKLKKQLNTINIKEIKNEIKNSGQLIEDKKKEIKYSYMQIDDMHKILIDIKNKKQNCIYAMKKIENEELEIIEEKERQYVKIRK